MEILILLIPMSVVLALLIGAAFWWSVKSGQFDDMEGPAHRILADDDLSDVIPDPEPCDNSPTGRDEPATSSRTRTRGSAH